MKALYPVLTLLLLLTACSSNNERAPQAHPPGNDVITLEAELAETRAELSAAKSERDRSAAQVVVLEARIDALRRNADVAAARISALDAQVNAAQAAQRSAAARASELAQKTSQLEDELARQSRELQYALEGLTTADAEIAGSSLDPEVLADSARVIQNETESALIKRVYYATNRNLLDRSTADYWKPFLLPLALLSLGALSLLFTRRYIKQHYQRRFRVGAVVVFGLAVVLTLGRGMQSTLQMLQRDQSLSMQYGNEIRRTQAAESPFERGYVDVSIPKRRAIAEVPRPQLLRFELLVDATRHFQLASIQPAASDDFYQSLQEVIDSDPANSAFVFVHGFHNTFEDAAFRTAQIAHDMRFAGAPIFFSWPSQGAVLDYLTDAKNAETTVVHLRAFLQELQRESGAERIHLIAHSMGSRALARALDDLQAEQPGDSRFGQLVFAAPDIARDLLEQKISSLAAISEGVTLYASAHDAALRLSRALQGEDEQNYQRAGETYPSPMVAPPMQTVDVSEAATGHSYISDSPLMLQDLAGLLSGSRTLDEQSENYVPAGYWRLQGKAP